MVLGKEQNLSKQHNMGLVPSWAGFRAKETLQPVICLPYKQEDLSLAAQSPGKKPGPVTTGKKQTQWCCWPSSAVPGPSPRVEEEVTGQADPGAH